MRPEQCDTTTAASYLADRLMDVERRLTQQRASARRVAQYARVGDAIIMESLFRIPGEPEAIYLRRVIVEAQSELDALGEKRPCGDCVHFEKCKELIQAQVSWTECDWNPSRFVAVPGTGRWRHEEIPRD